MKLEELEGEAREEVISLLEDLTDILGDKCFYDHHGYCQQHFPRQGFLRRRSH